MLGDFRRDLKWWNIKANYSKSNQTWVIKKNIDGIEHVLWCTIHFRAERTSLGIEMRRMMLTKTKIVINWLNVFLLRVH